MSESNRIQKYNFFGWTIEHLLNLKKQTQNAIAEIESKAMQEYKWQFRDGQRVYAKYKNGGLIFGTIVRVNYRTIRVKFDNGQSVLLPPKSLYMLDNSVFQFQNVLPFKQRSC